jgi:hypothetical protein
MAMFAKADYGAHCEPGCVYTESDGLPQTVWNLTVKWAFEALYSGPRQARNCIVPNR